MQLLYDGSRGGDLEGAVSTVAVLTTGQLRLVEEYQDLHHERNARLAELSRILSLARDEAEELAGRRADLERVRQRVDSEIKRLTRSQRSAESELEELRQRARGNTPEDIRVAVPWFKPSRNETDLLPDYFLRETDEWLVFPHEPAAVTPEELERHRPEIAAIVHGVKSRALSA